MVGGEHDDRVVRQAARVEVVGQPVRLSRTASRETFAPTPEYGADTDAVMREFGFDENEIGALKADGVI